MTRTHAPAISVMVRPPMEGSLVSLDVGLWCLRTAPEIWQTVVFTALTLSQMSHVMAIRSGDESLFKVACSRTSRS